MIANMLQKKVTFAENSIEFKVDEILQSKYQSLLEKHRKFCNIIQITL